MKTKMVFCWMLPVVLASGFIMGCDGVAAGSYKSIPFDLQGEWEGIEAVWGYVPGSGYQRQKGTLVVGYNSVTISGPIGHLDGFTRDIALAAYAEDGLFYIKDKGLWQNAIGYRRWDSADYKDELLTFSGGGVDDETFKRVAD
jgi:hypothetical protein